MSKRPITIRLDDALLAAMRRQADDENRTLTNLIETVLKRALAGAGSSPTALTLVAGPDAATPIVVLPTAEETNKTQGLADEA